MPLAWFCGRRAHLANTVLDAALGDRMSQQRPRPRRNRPHVQSGKPDGPAEFVLPPRRPRCPAPRLRGRARLTATRNKGPFDRRIGRWPAVKCESTKPFAWGL